MSDSDPTQAFLKKFSNALRGDRRWKQDTVVEIRAHLLEARDDVPREFETFEDIVQRFGDPALLATALNRQHTRAALTTQVTRAGRLLAIAATLTMAVTVAGVGWPGSSTPEPRPLLNTVVLARAALRVERSQAATVVPIDGATLGLSR